MYNNFKFPITGTEIEVFLACILLKFTNHKTTFDYTYNKTIRHSKKMNKYVVFSKSMYNVEGLYTTNTCILPHQALHNKVA